MIAGRLVRPRDRSLLRRGNAPWLRVNGAHPGPGRVHHARRCRNPCRGREACRSGGRKSGAAGRRIVARANRSGCARGRKDAGGRPHRRARAPRAEAPAPAVAPSAGESRGIFVQLGAFRTSDKAENLRDKVRREIAGLAERLLIEARDGMFRLHVGPYGSIDDARAIAARVGEALGLKPLLVRRGY